MSDDLEKKVAFLQGQTACIATDMAEVKKAVNSIAESLSKLAALEERHNASNEAISRAFEEIAETKETIKNISDKVHNIEVDMPILKLAKEWVFKGVLVMAGVVGLAILGLVII